MGELFRAIWGWLWRTEKASVAIEGFDRFARRMENRLKATEKRMDECDEDRAELRMAVGGLTVKVNECDEDRTELRERIDALESKTQ
jgi:chaperonin cofactor prefoldin